MLLTRIVIATAFLSVAGCASSPRYVAADDAADYGHYERKLSENRYRVNFNGNRRTGLQDTRDFALLRAAELTLANGYEWFEIVDRETATTERREPRAGFGYEQARVVYRECGVLACRESVRPRSYTSWSVATGRSTEKHSHSLEIVMGKGEMPESGNYYDAEAVVKAIYESV